MVASKQLQNLSLDVQGSSTGVKPGGANLKRTITIQNRGEQTAYVDLWLEPSDQQSAPLQRWGTFDKSEAELTLQPHQQLDVTLTFEVPLQVEPGFYSYAIRMRSSQYPGEDIRRVQQLQVLPSDQEAQLRSEPKLTLTPSTDSEHPHLLGAGKTLSLTVTVENPSRRTDRFFLTCLNLDEDWFTVKYPESLDNLPGLVTYTDGLQLNPRETGKIQLLIHPPAFAPAGNYVPTLRLTSRIREEIVLLRVVYITLAADDRLAVSLTPKTLPIPSLNQHFEIAFTNLGNIQRQLVYGAWDPERIIHYRIDPTETTLMPGQETIAQLSVHPRRWWNRLWRLKERRVNFDLLLENAPDPHPDPDTRIPTLPQPLPTGTVILKVRRRWLFWLLVISTTVALAWLVWEFLFWRPSLRPRITDFSTTQETYQEGEGSEPRLDWDISNPRQVGQLVLSSSNPDFLKTYQLNNNGVPLPLELEDAGCIIEVSSSSTSILETMRRFYRRWQTGSPNQTFLKCRGLDIAQLVNTENNEPYTFKEDTYDFRLAVMPTAGTHPLDISLLEDVVVAPPKPPQIQLIEATAAEYRTPSETDLVADVPTSEESFPDEESLPPGEPQEVAEPSPAEATVPVLLNWSVSNLEDIQTLRLVSLTPDGAENTVPVVYDFSGGIPLELEGFCEPDNNQLVCTQVPTAATDVGEYVFYLTVMTADSDPDAPIIKNTSTITVKPPQPEIVYFQVNGDSVLTRPRHVYPLNVARGSWDVSLTWKVRDAETIELLPAPGVILKDSIIYTLSAAPGAETITLRAVNELGEEVTQSVVIEKVDYVPGSQAPLRRRSAAPPAVEDINGLPVLPPPTVLPVPELAPIRTPPQAD